MEGQAMIANRSQSRTCVIDHVKNRATIRQANSSPANIRAPRYPTEHATSAKPSNHATNHHPGPTKTVPHPVPHPVP